MSETSVDTPMPPIHWTDFVIRLSDGTRRRFLGKSEASAKRYADEEAVAAGCAVVDVKPFEEPKPEKKPAKAEEAKPPAGPATEWAGAQQLAVEEAILKQAEKIYSGQSIGEKGMIKGFLGDFFGKNWVCVGVWPGARCDLVSLHDKDSWTGKTRTYAESLQGPDAQSYTGIIVTFRKTPMILGDARLILTLKPEGEESEEL
jgi:hypothetical protein